MRKVLCFLLVSAMTGGGYAQVVTLWKHVLRFEKDRSVPKGYVATKYCYRDSIPLYTINYSDNGWQIYDSTTYIKCDNLWYISRFDCDSDCKLYLRHTDTTKNLFYTNDELHYAEDRFGILSRYVNGINELIFLCKAQSPNSIRFHSGDTCCYYLKDVDHVHFFAHYGISMYDTLNNYCCRIGRDGKYEWDRYSFLEYTITRHFDYDKLGNLYRVTITRTHTKIEQKITWVESYILIQVDATDYRGGSLHNGKL